MSTISFKEIERVNLNMNHSESEHEIESKQLIEALNLVEQGNSFVAEHKFNEAKECFKKSLNIYPTADAYTYLGWMYTYDGLYTEAIDLCFKAIELDPDFGNPYNDIGVYLMRLGKLESSIKWFIRASEAKRYEPKHFPHLNLAQVYLKQGKLSKALFHLDKVLSIVPNHEQSVKLKLLLEPIVNLDTQMDMVN